MVYLYWLCFVNSFFLLLIVMVFRILLVRTDQGRDFIVAMLQGKQRGIHFPWRFFLMLGCWSYLLWYSACMVLQVEPYLGYVDVKEKGAIIEFEKATRYFAYFLGVLPCLLVAHAWWKVARMRKIKETLRKWLFISVSLVMGLGFYFMFKQFDHYGQTREEWPVQTRVAQNTGTDQKQAWVELENTAPMYTEKGRASIGTAISFFDLSFDRIKKDISYIRQYTDVKMYFIVCGAVFLLALLVFSNFKWNRVVSHFMRPSAITVIAFMAVTFLATVVAFFNHFPFVPLVLMVVIYYIAISFFNDNTEPEYTGENVQTKTMEEGIKEWIQWYEGHRKTTNDQRKKVRLYFVAAQGGGIRGVKWTGHVLNELNKKTGGKFMQQTFCISGVSGGGVGAVMYLAYLKDNGCLPADETRDKKFNQFLSFDQLSPLLANFAYPTMMQKTVLPFKVPSWDRAKVLGQTWSTAYKRYLNTTTPDKSFLSLWQDNKTHLPAMILNGTLAETGQRIMTGNLSLKPDKRHYERIDFYEDKKDISVWAAALNCCRFPVVTAGALFRRGGKLYGHIIDGGIRENTGLATTLDVLDEVMPVLREHNKTSEYKIVPTILYIKNSVDQTDEDPHKPYRILHGLMVPVLGLLKGIGAFRSASFLVNHLEEDAANHTEYDFEPVSLHQNKMEADADVELPLGWYLSDKACRAIDDAVTNFIEKDRFVQKVMEDCEGV